VRLLSSVAQTWLFFRSFAQSVRKHSLIGMYALFDYAFYCFYCLTSEKKIDRAGAANGLLFLFVFFFLMNICSLIFRVISMRGRFFEAGALSAMLAQALLYFTYFRPQAYLPLLAKYEQGEPNRLRWALVGVAMQLAVMFLPFFII
jgi:hypothetical protein